MLISLKKKIFKDVFSSLSSTCTYYGYPGDLLAGTLPV